MICRLRLHRAIRGAQGVLSMRVGGATGQLDLPSLKQLSVAGCGRQQLGVPHWATLVHYCKYLIIDPRFCGSRFSIGRLLAIEDFTYLLTRTNTVTITILIITTKETIGNFSVH